MSRASGARRVLPARAVAGSARRRASRPAPISRCVNSSGGLVAPRALLAELHEHVVQERRGAEAEEVGRHPRRARASRAGRTRYWTACFAVRIPPAGFIPTMRPVSSYTSRIDLEHAERHRQRRGRADLAGRGLDEVGAGGDREQRGAPDVVVRAELARLEDHLEVRLAAGLLDARRSRRTPSRSRPRGTRRGRSPCRSRRRRARRRRATSASLTSSGACPEGNAVATDATFTPLPRERAPSRPATRLG